MIDTLEWHEKFEALDPWFTRFEINGESFGGGNSYEQDPRVGLFFEWLGQPETILELSSFEGGHSVRLAAPPFVERLLGLEGRAENIQRAELVIQLLGCQNIEFCHADLDNDSTSLEQFGRFNAVFCAGLLYHLTHPWRLLEKIADVTDHLFLDTQVSATGDVTVEGYVGSMYSEGGYSDPLSGLSASSFWMTLSCLEDTLNNLGFEVRQKIAIPDWEGRGPRVHLAASKE